MERGVAKFTGREKELGLLQSALDGMRQKKGEVIFLSGEAGIGKSRLVREFMKKVEPSGVRFVWGTCFEQQRSTPFAPWAEVLASLARSSPKELLKKIHPTILSDLVRITPRVSLEPALEVGLKGWLKGAYVQTDTTKIQSAEQDRVRLFQSVIDFLLAHASDKGLVVFLDDVAWSDDTSIDLFQYLASKTGDEPILLIAAYRDVSVTGESRLQKAMNELNRLRLSEHMVLGPLAAEATAALVAGLIGGPPSQELTGLIYEKTNGNPFFIEELIASLKQQELLVEVGGVVGLREKKEALAIPATIKVLIQEKISRMDPEAIPPFTIAAMIGMQFEPEVLGKAASLSEDQLIHVIEEGLGASIVAEKTEPRNVLLYTFSDTRIREFLAEEVSALRRRKYHSLIGRSIEEIHAKDIDSYLEALAYHFSRGGEPEKSLDYSLRAGDRAASIFANREAVDHYRRALEVLESSDKPALRIDVLEKLGTVTFLTGETEDAIALIKQALELSERSGEKRPTAELCDRIGVMHYLSGYDQQKAQDYYAKGLTLLDGDGESTELAHLYQDMSRFYWRTGKFASAAEMAQKTLDIAQKLGKKEIEAHAYLTLALVLPPDETGALLEYEYKGLAIALEGGVVDAALRAYNNISLQHIFNGDVSKASKVLGDALLYAKKVGDIPREISFNQTLAYTYILLGELGKGKQLYDDLITTLPKHYAVIDETTLTDLGVIYLRLGDLQKSRESLEKLEAGLQGSSNFQALIHCYLAMANLCAASGDLISAESYLKKGYELFKTIGLNAFSSGLTPELFANLVEIELNLHKATEAKLYLDESKEIVAKLHGDLPTAYSSKAEGLLFAEKGDWTTAVKSLGESVDLWRRIGWPYELAEALYQLGRALDSQGDRARSREVLEEALELYRRMGATLGATKAQREIVDLARSG